MPPPSVKCVGQNTPSKIGLNGGIGCSKYGKCVGQKGREK